jgi:hypothetical protein
MNDKKKLGMYIAVKKANAMFEDNVGIDINLIDEAFLSLNEVEKEIFTKFYIESKRLYDVAEEIEYAYSYTRKIKMDLDKKMKKIVADLSN